MSDNPVLWRETRRPLMSRRWSWVAGVSVTALLLLSYAASAAIPGNPLGDEEYHIAYAFVFNALWWLLIAVLSGTAIAQEKESDTWTLLLVTPVSGRAIVFGKLLGLCRRMFWPLVLVVFHFCIFGLANVVSWQSALLVVWVMLTFNALWAALGVALSLVTRKVTTAVIVNLIVPVVLYAGVPLVLLVLGELLANNDNWAEITLWYLPYYYMGEGLNRLGKNFSWDRNAYLPGIGSQGTTGQFVQAAVAIGIAHVALAWVILQGTAARFDTIVGRARQRWVNAP